MTENTSKKQRNDETYRIITEHFAKYPLMQITDYFKLLFHSAFGCDHAVSSYERAFAYIVKESEEYIDESTPHTEELDGDYSRVYFSSLKCGLSRETLAAMFFLSAKHEAAGRELLEEKLSVLRRAATDGVIPLSVCELDECIEEWRTLGYPAVRHSDIYRESYKPSYRVVANRYARLLGRIIERDKTLSEKNGIDIEPLFTENDSEEMRKTLAEIYTFRKNTQNAN